MTLLDKMNAEDIIRLFKLIELPGEGGYFSRIHYSSNCSSIVYLITRNNFSRLHKVKADEVFHHYMGDSVEMFLFDENGKSQKVKIGKDFDSGERPYQAVPAHTWQGSRLVDNASLGWSLLGATVAPPYSDELFELGDLAKLSKEFPHLEKEIQRYC